MPDPLSNLSFAALGAIAGASFVALWALLIYWIARAPTFEGRVVETSIDRGYVYELETKRERRDPDSIPVA